MPDNCRLETGFQNIKVTGRLLVLLMSPTSVGQGYSLASWRVDNNNKSQHYFIDPYYNKQRPWDLSHYLLLTKITNRSGSDKVWQENNSCRLLTNWLCWTFVIYKSVKTYCTSLLPCSWKLNPKTEPCGIELISSRARGKLLPLKHRN